MMTMIRHAFFLPLPARSAHGMHATEKTPPIMRDERADEQALREVALGLMNDQTSAFGCNESVIEAMLHMSGRY